MSTATQPLTIPRIGISGLLREYTVLVKSRVTTLLMLTAWCGAYLAAVHSGESTVSWTIFNAIFGIGLVSGGTAALNEVMERDLDARMRRTAVRPLVTKTLSVAHAMVIASMMTLGGLIYLWLTTNWQAALLTALTAACYLMVYTPMKQVHPICTFLGAFPGAMPPLLGWVAVRGRIEPEAIVLFAIMFFWQFPHFHSIAWLYREDYEGAGVRMLPVVHSDGRSTVRAIVLYAVALVPVTLAPTLMGMAGWTYFFGALVLGIALLWASVRMWTMKLAPVSVESKPRARQLLQATVLYLPLLFALMMLNRAA